MSSTENESVCVLEIDQLAQGPARDRTPVVVLALREDEFPTESLRRADALCEAMAADLRVIRVIHHFAGLSPALREFEVRDAAQALDEVLALRAATSAWIDTVLGHALPQSQLEVQRGDYVDLTCERALQLEAALIVVSPSQRLRDSSVESIATFSNTPVLVARWRAETSPLVVAATDLEDVGFPVLRAAAELARVLGASLVPVHNVSPLPALLRGAVSHPRSMRSRNCWIEAAKQQKQGGLARALGELQLDESGVVSEDNDAARAILQEARARNADLVVVGLRRRSWLDRLLSPSVASAVVRGARRSVLVTPLTRSHAQAPS